MFLNDEKFLTVVSHRWNSSFSWFQNKKLQMTEDTPQLQTHYPCPLPLMISLCPCVFLQESAWNRPAFASSHSKGIPVGCFSASLVDLMNFQTHCLTLTVGYIPHEIVNHPHQSLFPITNKTSVTINCTDKWASDKIEMDSHMIILHSHSF